MNCRHGGWVGGGGYLKKKERQARKLKEKVWKLHRQECIWVTTKNKTMQNVCLKQSSWEQQALKLNISKCVHYYSKVWS